MKKVLVLIVAMFALLSAPLMAADHDSSFGLKMKSAGFRWNQDMDQFSDFWGSENNNNYARVFGTAYVGSKTHEVTAAYQQNSLSAPWDVFQGRDQIGDALFIEYQYNFDQ
jgi:hypothetical protein